jgi:hypothetical protein
VSADSIRVPIFGDDGSVVGWHDAPLVSYGVDLEDVPGPEPEPAAALDEEADDQEGALAAWLPEVAVEMFLPEPVKLGQVVPVSDEDPAWGLREAFQAARPEPRPSWRADIPLLEIDLTQWEGRSFAELSEHLAEHREHWHHGEVSIAERVNYGDTAGAYMAYARAYQDALERDRLRAQARRLRLLGLGLAALAALGAVRRG